VRSGSCDEPLVSIDADDRSVRPDRLGNSLRDCASSAPHIQHRHASCQDHCKAPMIFVQSSSIKNSGVGLMLLNAHDSAICHRRIDEPECR